MHLPLLVSAGAVVIIAGLLLPVLKAVFSPLRSVPGPAAARFTDLWYFWRVKKGYFEQDNIELHRKHGKHILFHQINIV